MNKPNKRFYKGWHHFYLGIIFMMIGFWCLFHTYDWIAIPVILIGLYLVLDDLYQHWRQSYDIDYHSPLHRLYTGWRKPYFIIWLNEKMDKLLGRK